MSFLAPILEQVPRPYRLEYDIFRAYHAGPAQSLHNPLHGGAAIINPKRLKRATIGGIVSKGGRHYIMTNEHFLRSRRPENANQPLVGFSAAGIWDGADPPVAITVPYPSDRSDAAYMDAGIAEPLVPVSYDIPGIGIPTGAIAPQKGMKVIAFGASSGFHKGEVTNTNVTNLYIEPNPPNTATSKLRTGGGGKGFVKARDVVQTTIDTDPGDSGCWIVQEGTRKVVGVHFGPTTTGGGKGEYCIRATTLASAFGVSFTGSPGTFQPARGQTGAPKVTGVGSEAGDPLRQDFTLPSNPIEAIMNMIQVNPQARMVAMGMGGIIVLYLLTRGR